MVAMNSWMEMGRNYFESNFKIKKESVTNEKRNVLISMCAAALAISILSLVIYSEYRQMYPYFLIVVLLLFIASSIALVMKYYSFAVLALIAGCNAVSIGFPWFETKFGSNQIEHVLVSDFILENACYLFIAIAATMMFWSREIATTILLVNVLDSVALCVNQLMIFSDVVYVILLTVKVIIIQVAIGAFLMLKHHIHHDEEKKAEFTSKITHELRTPLHAICGVLEMLSLNNDLPEQRELIQMAAVSAVSMLHLVNDLLDQSQLQSAMLKISKESSSIRDTIASVMYQVATLVVSKKLILNVTVNADVPVYVLTDHRRFGQILLNFVSNAIKFTPEGNSIKVVVSAIAHNIEKCSKPSLDCWCLPENCEARKSNYSNDSQSILIPIDPNTSLQEIPFLLQLDVIDSGSGIPLEKQGEMFQQYSQLDPTKPGTGLGLSICKQLVELLNGYIGYNNNMGCAGATFFVKIPVSGLHKASEVFEMQIDSRFFVSNSQSGESIVAEYEDANSLVSTEPSSPKNNLNFETILAESTSTTTLSRKGSQNRITSSISSQLCENINLLPIGTVLIAEDDLASQKIVERMLTRMRYPFIITNNGEECFNSYIKNQKDIVAILLDKIMPVMGGEDTLSKIRDYEVANGLKSVKIVMVSADAETIKSGHEVEILCKPFSYSQLKSVLISTSNSVPAMEEAPISEALNCKEEIVFNSVLIESPILFPKCAENVNFSKAVNEAVSKSLPRENEFKKIENPNFAIKIRHEMKSPSISVSESDAGTNYSCSSNNLISCTSKTSSTAESNPGSLSYRTSKIETPIFTIDRLLQTMKEPSLENLSTYTASPQSSNTCFTSPSIKSSKLLETPKLSKGNIHKRNSNSKFISQIPQINEQNVEITKISDAEEESPFYGIVLCADDHLMNQKLVERFLKSIGFESVMANDGEECFNLYTQNPSKFCSILMDCQMPNMDGYESTRRIREFEKARNLPHKLICALTADNSDFNSSKCFECGMDSFLTKPASIKQLAAVLHQHISAPTLPNIFPSNLSSKSSKSDQDSPAMSSIRSLRSFKSITELAQKNDVHKSTLELKQI